MVTNQRDREMEEWLRRTQQLLGEDKLQLLQQAHVLVVGVGGVGAYAAEMICRAGVGRITLVDGDVVGESNINRQLIALHSTLGKPKAEVLAQRLLDINPSLQLEAKQLFLEETAVDALLDEVHYDFVVDAIDTLAPKVALIERAMRRKVKIVSSMGAGGRVDPTAIAFADIANTYHCALAKAVRKRLATVGIRGGLKVVFSTEQTNRNAIIRTDEERNKKSTVGTISYLPAIFGCYLASYVIRKLAQL